ncbi:hypothetical protein PUN28_013976 [Cardiocondyla obscurior]|uniref:Uncharacterized protein n=1 Tax=Cardiocondyla obscurior TaxID=286306 RepID=A0AAW2F9U0_9HYME
MPPKRTRRGRRQPKTPKYVPPSPEGSDKPDETDKNNNLPTIQEEIIFPPGTTGILKGVTTQPTPSPKPKHITGFVLRPWVLHEIDLEPPRLTRPPKIFLKGPYDHRVWRDTLPNWPKPPPNLITGISESVATQTEKHLFDHAPVTNEKVMQTDPWVTTSEEEEINEPLKYPGNENEPSSCARNTNKRPQKFINKIKALKYFVTIILFLSTQPRKKQ